PAETVLGSVEGVNLAQSSDAIVKARQHLDAGELERAADLTLRLREELDVLKRQGDEATTALRRLREMVADADAMNLPLSTTTGLLERADRAYKMGQFDEALDHAAQAEAEASKERDRGIAVRMRGFEETLRRARMDGTDTRSADRLYERAREFFRAKKYRQAIAAAEQSEEEAERVGLQQGMAKQAVEAGEVERARSAFAGSIDWGLGLLNSWAREELAKAEPLVETCRKMEVDPTPIQNKLSEARTLIDSENFREALALVRSARDVAQS